MLLRVSGMRGLICLSAKPTGAFEAPLNSHSRKKLKESANPQPFAVVGGGSFNMKKVNDGRGRDSNPA